MINNHFTDKQAQLFATGAVMDNESRVHLAGCEHCRELLNSYSLLFQSIEQIEKENFDFDIAAAVITKLEKPSPREGISWIIWLLAIAGLGVCGGGLYFFRSYLHELFNTAGPYLMLVGAFTMISLCGIVGWDIYQRYEKKLNQIDLLNKLQHNQ